MILSTRSAVVMICLLFYVTLVSGCKQNSDLSSASLPPGIVDGPATGNPDGYLEVDCLLPGQVRKLGSMIYASPRRPVKSTANDCTIRGGEYVAYDRANYKESLAVWMVEAETGDPVAQTYVGEIYLKSPPGSPRYDLAAKWFEKAAKSNNKRAQINLGYLYENGLGVQEDLKKAAILYGQASGSNVRNIVQQHQLSQEERAEFESLKRDNAEQIVELRRLKNDKESTQKLLKASQGELRSKSRAIQLQEQDIARQMNEMGRIEQLLQARTATVTEDLEERIAELHAGFNQKEQELSEQKKLASGLSGQVQKFQNEAEDSKAALQTLNRKIAELSSPPEENKRELANLQTQNAAQQRELTRLQAERNSAEQNLLTTKNDLEKSRISLQKQQRQIAMQQGEMATIEQELGNRVSGEAADLREKLAAMKAGLMQKEAELQEQKAFATNLHEQVEKHKGEAKNFQSTLMVLNEKMANLPGPKIEILDPQLLRTRGITFAKIENTREERTVTGKIWSPAGLTSFKVNGENTELDTDGRFRSVLLMDVEDVQVQIVAMDQNGKSDEMTFTMQKSELRTPGGAGGSDSGVEEERSIKFGNYYALIIGNNDYEKLPKLKTAVEDAKIVSRLLEDNYGFEVQTLYNANRNTILSTLNSYRKRLTEKDNFLIYYAGHGTLEERNTQGFWLPVDSSLDDDVNWIPTDRITGIMNLMSAKQIMVVADACYSGIMTRAALTRLESGRSKEAYSKWLKKMATYKSRVIISSGETKPVLDGGGGKHSVFAKALLDTLRTNTKIMLGIDLHRSIAEKVVDVSGRLGHDQVPQYAGLNRAGHELGDFLFVPKTSDG